MTLPPEDVFARLVERSQTPLTLGFPHYRTQCFSKLLASAALRSPGFGNDGPCTPSLLGYVLEGLVRSVSLAFPSNEKCRFLEQGIGGAVIGGAIMPLAFRLITGGEKE